LLLQRRYRLRPRYKLLPRHIAAIFADALPLLLRYAVIAVIDAAAMPLIFAAA